MGHQPKFADLLACVESGSDGDPEDLSWNGSLAEQAAVPVDPISCEEIKDFQSWHVARIFLTNLPIFQGDVPCIVPGEK